MHKALFFITLASLLPTTGATLSWELQVFPETWSNSEFFDVFSSTQFPGLITLDDSQLPIGNAVFQNNNEPEIFSMALLVAGYTYTQDSDPAEGFPALHFDDGELTGLDYLIMLTPETFDSGAFLQLYPDGSMAYSPNGVTEYEGSYQTLVQSIPEPGISALALSAILLGSTKRKR